jgi:hypothetical protein
MGTAQPQLLVNPRPGKSIPPHIHRLYYYDYIDLKNKNRSVIYSGISPCTLTCLFQLRLLFSSILVK